MKQFNRILPAALAAGCLALIAAESPARAQIGQIEGAGSNSSMADKMFVKKAMTACLAEVELGLLAAQKASSNSVRQFGQKMVEEHTRLNDRMKSIAGLLGVAPPDQVPPRYEALHNKLEGLSGDAFDKAYIEVMVKDHQKDLAEFKKEASSGRDAQVKEAAEQGTQAVAEHLQLAEQIAGRLGMSGNKGAMTRSMEAENAGHQ